MSTKVVFVPLFALLAACDTLGGGGASVEPVAIDEGEGAPGADTPFGAPADSPELVEEEAATGFDAGTPEAKRRKSKTAAQTATAPEGEPGVDDLINGDGEAARQDESDSAAWDGGLDGEQPGTLTEGL